MSGKDTHMAGARIIDGKALAERIRSEVADGVALLQRTSGVTPGLAVVLVGQDPASEIYVRNKARQTIAAGMLSFEHLLAETTSEAELLRVIAALNADSRVHGILVQLPLPRGLDEGRIVRLLDPAKDVDGLHPHNVAALVLGRPGLRPCTPSGCIELCDRHGIELAGRDVLVIGRSMLVGKPLAFLALERHATVTIAHSRTTDLAAHVARADVVVAAVGRPGLVRGAWIRPGAAVLDVGINRLPGGQLAGDVEFEAARERAAWITPVPGGVGPMTIAMLLANTLQAAAAQTGNLLPPRPTNARGAS